MLQAEQIDELMLVVAALDRATVLEQIRGFQARFPIDFSREFLESQTLERLRHLLFALCVQNQQIPAPVAPAAA